MLTAAESSQIFFYEICMAGKSKTLRKYLKEKCYPEYYQELSFKYFVKSFLFIEIMSQISKIQTTILGVTHRDEWVKLNEKLHMFNHLFMVNVFWFTI